MQLVTAGARMNVELTTITGAVICVVEIPCLTPPMAVRHDGDVFILDPSTQDRRIPEYRLVTSAQPTRVFQ